MTATNTQPEHTMPGNLNQQQTGTTQAQSALAIRTDMVNNYNTMAPELRQFPVQEPQRHFYCSNPLSAMSQQYHSPIMNQTTWSSPQSMSADEFDNNYSYHHNQAVPTSYASSQHSPRTWPSTTQTPPPAAPQFNLPLRCQEQPFDGLNNHVPMPPDDLRDADLHISLHYDNGAFQHGFESRHYESENMKYESSPATDAPGSPYTGSPASFHGDIKIEPDVVSDLGDQSSAPSAPPTKDAASKDDEPYARLIHKALLSAPDYSLTLQELYTWFKENTDKPKRTEKDGWQNSIRHNLSMNDGFLRREKVTYTHIEGQQSSEKRVSQWYLNPVFINDLKPTTHFRKGSRESSRNPLPRRKTTSGASARRNSPPRSSHVTHYQNPDYPNRSMPGRAISGRKGGRAATNSRNARRLRSQTGSLSPVLAQQQYQHQQQQYQQQLQQPLQLQHYHHQPHAFPPHLQELHARAEEASGQTLEACGGFQQQQQQQQARIGAPVSPNIVSPIVVPSSSAGIAPGNFVAPPYQFQPFAMTSVAGVYNQPQNDDVIYGWGSNAQL
ncbi:hypothetical protein EsH8_VII_001013 [Colletotrichum jinshuiense]